MTVIADMVAGGSTSGTGTGTGTGTVTVTVTEKIGLGARNPKSALHHPQPKIPTAKSPGSCRLVHCIELDSTAVEEARAVWSAMLQWETGKQHLDLGHSVQFLFSPAALAAALSLVTDTTTP